MAESNDAVYCTLLMSDSYLPGVMVLAHSLRDNGTKAKLVVLVTSECLHASTLDELETIYDEVIPINRINNISPANLYLMDRPDLVSTFSKIELWRQIQYSQIVYIDADVVALRAPDELLSLDTNLAAVPDIGWPDCFNTGVLVLRPNMQDYYSLLAYAQRGISFDGADQGLLNMHFKNWSRLSFTYNCTPSGHYQYIPAFRHFQSTISLVHYIGRQKPWRLPRNTPPAEGPYNQLLARWWAVYDRHYRPGSSVASLTKATLPLASTSQQKAKHVENRAAVLPDYPASVSNIPGPRKTVVPEISHAAPVEIVKTPTISKTATASETSRGGALAPQPARITETPAEEHSREALGNGGPVFVQRTPRSERDDFGNQQVHTLSVVPRYVGGEEHVVVYRDSAPSHPQMAPETARTGTTSGGVVKLPQILHPRPEASSQPRTRYHDDDEPVSQEQERVVDKLADPAEAVPSPRIAVWDASRAPPPIDSEPEASALPSQTYTMSKSTNLFRPPESYPEAPKNMYYDVPEKLPQSKPPSQIFPWEGQAPPATRVFTDDLQATEEPSVPPAVPRLEEKRLGSATTTARAAPMEESSWGSYVHSSVWDEIPEIERYIQAIQKPRRGKIQVVSGHNPTEAIEGRPDSGERRSSIRLTDFPPETERPSLPVTPAPITRQRILDENQEEPQYLQAAEGVPNQGEWNPMDRLEELHRRQSEFLEHSPPSTLWNIPRRSMPGGGGLGE